MTWVVPWGGHYEEVSYLVGILEQGFQLLDLFHGPKLTDVLNG
jgi:hypothetical protein